MDPLALLAAIPGLGPVLPYAALLVAFCAAVAAFLRPPAGPGAYAVLYAVVNAIGCNFGRARNAPPPGKG